MPNERDCVIFAQRTFWFPLPLRFLLLGESVIGFDPLTERNHADYQSATPWASWITENPPLIGKRCIPRLNA